MAENETGAAAQEAENAPQLALQRIYVKDISFESPNSPDVFQIKWAPQVKLDINSGAKKIKDGLFEVVLTLTASVSNEDQPAYLVEVQQAGIFAIQGLEGTQLEQALAVFCPNLLFPYAREAIDSMLLKGSFPPMHLAPVNFEAIYFEAKKRQQQEQEGGEAAPDTTH